MGARERSAISNVSGVGLTICVLTGCMPPPPAHEAISVVAVGILLDTSDSTDTTSRCAEAEERLHDLLMVHGLKRLDVVIYGTGDRSSNAEPSTLVGWTEYRADHHLFEQSAKVGEARSAWLADVRASCEGRLRQTRDSPIRLALERARDGLVAHCAQLVQHGEVCARRILALHSDMRESWDRAITERFKGRGRKLVPLELAGSEFVGCGIANHRRQWGDAAPSRIASTWSELLGPDAPPFDPSCPMASVHDEGGPK